MSDSGLPPIEPSPTKLKTDPILPAKPKNDNAPTKLKNPPRKSSETKIVRKEVDGALPATPFVYTGLRFNYGNEKFGPILAIMLKAQERGLIDVLLARAREGLDEVLDLAGTTWKDLESESVADDYYSGPYPASLFKIRLVVGEEVLDVRYNMLDIRNMNLKCNDTVGLVFVIDISLKSISRKGVDEKNTPTVVKRRRSTDTMSPVSMPPPPYVLVDCEETQRLRDLMG